MGKSNLYQEAVSVPLIVAGPDVPVGRCDAPVSLLYVAATIPAYFGLRFECEGKPLGNIAVRATDPDRVNFREYHALGAVSAA